MRFWTVYASIGLLALGATSDRGDEEASGRTIPKDVSLVETAAPRGTQLTVDGKDAAGESEFRCNLETESAREISVAARFADGSHATLKVRVRGGWRIPVHLRSERTRTPAIVPQVGHSGFTLYRVAISPDGATILTGGGPDGDDTAILWDAKTGEEIRAIAGHTERVWEVAFSGDGLRTLTASADGTEMLWDLRTGSRLQIFPSSLDDYAVAFSRDGKRVLTGSDGHNVALWDAAAGKKLRVFAGHSDSVSAAAFSPDGNRILTGSLDNTAILWDATTGERLRTFAGHLDGVISVAFSPDGKQILTGSGNGGKTDNTVILWDVSSGDKLRTFAKHTNSVLSVAFSQDGRKILTGSADNTAIVWNVATGESLRTFNGKAPPINGVAFSPDGRHVLIGSGGNVATMWDIETGEKTRDFAGRVSPLASTAFSSKGDYLLTASPDALSFWPSRAGQTFRSVAMGADGLVSAKISPDARQVAVASGTTRAYIFDAATAHEPRLFNGNTESLVDVAFSPDGRQIATIGLDRIVVIWDARTGEKIRSLPSRKGMMQSLAFTTDGRRLLTTSGYSGTGNDDNTAILLDVATGAVDGVFGGHAGNINFTAMSPDGRRILTCADSATLWDAATGKKIWELPATHRRIAVAAFSPDGSSLLAKETDGTLALWDVETGKPLMTFTGSTITIRAIAFSPDGSQAVTGSSDGMARLWSTATGQELARLITLDAGKEWLVVTPDGLFDGSEGGRNAVRFRVGDELKVVPPEQGFQDYYHPGLLQEILAGHAVAPPERHDKKVSPKPRDSQPERK